MTAHPDIAYIKWDDNMTLYNLLEQFLAAGYIVETRAEGRRRSYQLTAEGETLLQNEVERLQAQVRDYEKLFER